MGLNSTEVAWSDCEIFLNGVGLKKVTSIRETSEQETEEIYGAGDEPIDIQTGNRKYGLAVAMYKSVIDAMNAAAIAVGGRDLMDVSWTVVWSFKPTATAPRQTLTYANWRVSNYERGMEQNAKSMPITLTGRCLRPIAG